MKFLLVSAENPDVKKEIDIPEEMVKKPKKPRKTPTKPPKSINRVQRTNSII